MYVLVCFFVFFSVHLFFLMCELLVDVPPPPLCFNPATVFWRQLADVQQRRGGNFGGVRKRLFDSVFFYQKAKNIRKRTFLCLTDVAGGGR